MLFDLMTLLLAPTMLFACYGSYGAHRPFTQSKRLWLLVGAVLATVACLSSIIGLTAAPTGVVGAVFDLAGGFSLLLEGGWFFLATRRSITEAV